MTRPDPPVRLVVRLPNWLGDTVMALPALQAVRRAFPDAWIALAGQLAILPVFEEATGVAQEQLLPIERRTETATLGAGQFDTALLLTNSFRTAWTAKRGEIPARWGYAAGIRGPLLTRQVARPRRTVHQAEFYLELVRGLGVEAPAGAPRISVSDASLRRARRLLDAAGVRAGTPMVGFAPGAAYGHAKRWPPQRVAAVVARLVAEHGVTCVLVGAAADREAGRAIESSLPADARVVNLIGRTDLRALMGVLAACRAFVSNDSGAMHLAAAVGVPVTAIFGPTDERATAPVGDHDVILQKVFCRPCMLRECPIDHRCMTRISVDEVYAAVSRRLAAPR